jgi:hypothetical protein
MKPMTARAPPVTLRFQGIAPTHLAKSPVPEASTKTAVSHEGREGCEGTTQVSDPGRAGGFI